ncbi:conserved hypothetical protein [delta proteobacterium NaphS2]|nr:conserved hypothetical protein [delta proteobacterium NaphS2]
MDMKKKITPMPKKKESNLLIKEITKFSGDRLHVEIPSERRSNFKPGDNVAVKKIDPKKIKF